MPAHSQLAIACMSAVAFAAVVLTVLILHTVRNWMRPTDTDVRIWSDE